jgi:hypothetical protein
MEPWIVVLAVWLFGIPAAAVAPGLLPARPARRRLEPMAGHPGAATHVRPGGPTRAARRRPGRDRHGPARAGTRGRSRACASVR